MMNEAGFRRALPVQSSGSAHTVGTLRHPSVIDPILSKRVCFYKSGDPQFSGLRMVINNRTFKTFDALLDSLSKKVPLPFGVRNITTPRGVHAVYTLDELEDGKSYICSDSRKVKPINLALARKKLPPWYHARPASSRRRTVQQGRMFPGKNLHKQEPVLVRTPKRLLVFCNGDPNVKHTVVLNKRTTPTFESILEYISELIQFRVVKLHTADGRRVDGLPGLILCSGTVVAAGREPFKHANYYAQKSPVPTILSTKRTGNRRLKRKRKPLSYTSKSRNFSPSSERYIVNRIQSSIAGSSCDLPSHSAELESGRMPESVPETPDTCLGIGSEEQESLLPADDDIEKSFRVNQDGSMTVEMKVRLTIKEEETIHWTTTLSRSSVANQLNMASLPEAEAEQEISSLKSNSLHLQSPAASIDSVNGDKTQDNNDKDPPSLSNGAFSEGVNEEDDIKTQMEVVSPTRAPTPGHKQIRKKQTSVESIKSVTAEGIREGMIGSYSYREQTENGAMTEQYCMVKQSRPVPKPRRLGSVDVNNVNSRNVSMFKSAEILQIESSGDEVTETVLHVYEQQTCQENFFANVCAQTASGIPFCRPATSETGQLSSNNDFEPQPWRPSTASESVSIWRAESMSVTSDLTSPSLRSQITNAQQQVPKPKPQQREVNKDKRVSPKHKVMNKRVHRLMSPAKRLKENSAGTTEKSKKVKTFSSAGFIKKIYGSKSKSVKSMKLKKGPMQNKDGGDLKEPHTTSALEETTSETVSYEQSVLNVDPNEVTQPRGILTRQTSMHQEKNNVNGSYDVRESMSLPAFNSSSSVTNEYVENWLEKAHLNTTAQPNEESKKIESQTENGTCGESENKNGLIVAERVKCLEEISKTQTLKPDLLANTERRGSVKQRIQSFENKSSSSPIEKTTVNQQGVESHTNTTRIENNSSLAQNNIQEITSLSDHNCSEIIAPTESPIKISIPEATPSHMLSMDLPSPPPPAEYTELSNTEDGVTDASSVASSPLYRLSSLSSQMSDNHPLSISPTSDKAVSPTDHTMQTTTSIQTDIPSTPREAPLQRTPSIKRAPLVSNKSFDREMSLRKACLDKYTLCSDATSETSKPINIVGNNVLPNGNCSSGTQQSSETPQEETQQSNNRLDLKSSLSCSPSPASLITEERISPASILSSEAPTPSGHPYKETKSEKTNVLTQKEASLPKHFKELTSSPSLERKSQTKMVSSELPHNSPKLSLHNQTQEKTTSPNIGIRRQATPDASPSTERKLYKPKLQKRLSPYSQSLDVVSPPVRHKSSGKVLSRNLSSDDASEPTNKTQRKTPSLRKRHQMPQAIKPATELDKTGTCIPLMPLEADQNDEDKVTGDLLTADKEKAATQITPQPLNITNQPNMKPVLDKICYSIKSIRQITQNKRPSCLERSNSLPDFSSHVASTFGSSSKALLAFLSVMTLKEGMTNLNINELNANNVSCAEALKMIDSLREIASMEDSQKLTASLSSLQKSASKQLLQSWKGFQELSEKSKSRSSTPNDSEQEVVDEDRDEKDCNTDEDFIDEIMSSLDIPEELKEELASLSVKSDNNVEETVSARIIEKEEAKDYSHVSNVATEDPVNVREDTQDDKVNVNVSSMIKKFTDIDQPKQSSTCSLTKESKGKDSLYGQKCPKAEPFVGQILEQQQPYKTVLSEKDNRQQGHDDGDLSQEKVSMNGVVNSKKGLEQDSCTSKVEEGNQLLMHDEESIPENELTPKNESSSDEEGQNMSSATKDLEQNVTCEQSLTSSESGEQRSSEEELEVEWEEVQQERSESDGLSVPECHSEDEKEKQPSSDYYAEMNLRGRESMSSPDNQNKSLSEEPELECQGGSMGLNVSVDESTCNSDVDERSSEEEQPQVECKELKVIIEESSSGLEEEEEEHHDDPLDHREQTQTCRGLNALIEEPEEDKVSSDDEDYHTRSPVEGDLGNLIENKDSSTKKDSLIKSDSLVNTEEDSGNDHSTCDEHVELQLPKVEDEHINSSNEEELSYDEKEFSSEEEHVNMERYIEENCADYQEAPAPATQSEDTKCEKEVEKLTHHPEEITQSVAERVILLEKQAAESQKTTESPAIRRSSQRNAPLESDVDDLPSESPTSQSVPCSRSAPQSSLSFSYDSSSVITTEPEGNRVKSIREMFLAKTTTDIQHGHGRLPSPKRSVVRAQTSTSGGYQSQTSSELSSGEDDSARKSISKGFVRRTIERLYGKKDPDDEVIERPPSAPKQKKNDHSSIFSPFHIARSKAMSEMSYFNSTNALDTLSEAARCIAFNSQVRPGDSIPIDQEQWLLRENTLIRKSASDPVGINKNFTNSPQCEEMCKDTEDTPYSLFSTKSEQEDKRSTFSRKCTYFSLPNTSGDSDPCQDDLSTVSKSSVNGDSIVDTKDNSEDTKTWAERNGTLPGVGVTDFKMMDNKVHPLVEPPPDGEAVVVQPKKGQGVMSRRLQEPDMLDILYDFCGQNCPIL